VQAHAGGVEEDLDRVLHDGKAQLVGRAGLRHPAEAVLLLQARDGGLLDDGLAVRHRVQLAVEAVTLDGKSSVLRDKLLERERLDALEQLLEAAGLELAEQDHHPLAHAAAEIGAGHVGKFAVKKDAPVLGADVLKIEPAQLVGHQALETEQAGYAKSHVIPPDITSPSKIRFLFPSIIRADGANSKSFVVNTAGISRNCRMTSGPFYRIMFL